MSKKAHQQTPRHPRPYSLHLTYWRLAVMVLMASLAGWAVANPAEGAAQGKKKHPLEMVVTGSVYTEQGFSLPGASIRVNRVGEKKTQWQAVSDRRGEFGFRLPQGAEYEVHVKAKDCEEQMQKVDGNSSTFENLVFRMVPVTAGKKPSEGGKKP